MRLLIFDDRGTPSLTTDLVTDIPPYAILSHTWGANGDEVTFKDVQSVSGKSKAGYAKIQFCGEQARKNGLHHIWVDTCCIDKSNNAELSEALNSMFRWYSDAARCYVYLSDVSAHECDNNNQSRNMWERAFRKSRWFTRGWTLQELLAPKSVEFFSREGERLGDKDSLEGLIHEVTDIPIGALRREPLSGFSIEERLRWTEKRDTKRQEDKAYSLLGIFNVFIPPIYGEGENAWVRLREEIKKSSLDLNKIPYAKGANYNSYDQDHTICHAATRVDLLRQIQDWAQDPHGKSIFWLNGMAGTGKSTISRTVAQWLTCQGRLAGVNLGASFFFKRGEGDRGSASRFFPTIVRELILKIPGLDRFVADVIDSEPFIFDKLLGEQFDRLIYQPLLKVKIFARTSPTLVVVVDALDECEKERDIKAIISLWARLIHITTVRLRLFLTSRPDLPIQLGFEDVSVDAYQDLILQDAVPQTTIRQDILTFLEDEFAKIRKENAQLFSNHSQGRKWPADEVVQSLVGMAVPLFIVAATVARYVGALDPPKRLEKILGFQKQGKLGQIGQMEQTYLPVLTQRPTMFLDSDEEEEFFQNFRNIVGSIVTLAEPLSRLSLAALLDVNLNTIEFHLKPLHSVLRVPADFATPIRTLHLSFGEFLLSDKLRDKPFGIDGPAMHRFLLAKCLELLSGPDVLRENMCDLRYPGQPRREVASTTISKRLSPALQYACQYWVHHVQCSKIQIYDDDKVHMFLRSHFLHWLEALSLMNRISEAIGKVHVLQLLLSPFNSTCLSQFLEDARRVILANRYVADLAPLQIYSSAMVFAPQMSVVKKVCGQIPKWVQKSPITPAIWSSDLQKLEGHMGAVRAVAFSHDGSLLASASSDDTVRLWDPTTGQEVQKLEGHTGSVWAVAFLHNGSLLASASADGTVRLWDPTTGQEVQKLEGHTGAVWAVAFSHDGSLLASASDDKAVRLWDPTTGQEVQKLEGHTSTVRAVAFSHDGSLLASASADGTVRLWDPTTGQEVQKLEGHIGAVYAVAFSHDGSLLASASDDKAVRLWDPATGQEVQKLEGHIGAVWAVAFSHDGSLLASASYDETVRLWDPATGQEVQKLEGHSSTVRWVAFSHDGSLLASASFEKTVRLWDPTTGHEVKKLEGHTSTVYAVAFSHDSSLLASASYDRTIRLWDPTTGQEVQKLEGHTSTVRAVAFSYDSSLLASASDDGTVGLWNPTTGQELQKLEGHTKTVWAVAFSHDGSLLASASVDETVRLWDPTTGQEVQKLEGHIGAVWAVAFSHNGSLLASASYDKTVRLWDPTTGQELQKFEKVQSTRIISFSIDEKIIITDQGALHVDNRFISDRKYIPATTRNFHIKDIVMMNDSWVQQGLRNLLWLPHEYRGKCNDIHGNMLAIGQHSGHVSFIQLDYH